MLLQTLTLLFILSLLAFLSSNLYLPSCREQVQAQLEVCHTLEAAGSSKVTECREELRLKENLELFLGWVLFLSLCCCFVLLVVVFVCLLSKDRRLRRHERQCQEQELRIAGQNNLIQQYQKRLKTNKKVELKYVSEVGRIKADAEGARDEVDALAALNESLDQQNVTLAAQRDGMNQQVCRMRVKDRTNWAKSAQLRKTVADLQEEARVNVEWRNEAERRFGKAVKEKEELAQQLQRGIEERERMQEELAQKLERGAEERERMQRLFLQEKHQLERRLEEAERSARLEREERERMSRDHLRERDQARQGGGGLFDSIANFFFRSRN